MSTTVVIAEDNTLLREGLVRLLSETGFTVCAAASDATTLTELVAEHQPDLVLLDVRMPPTMTDEGMRAAIDIRQKHPDMAVVVLSQYVEHAHAHELLAAGTAGVGYLLKDRVADVDDFASTLDRVVAGGTAIDPDVVSQLLTAGRAGNPVENLTPREREVLEHMAAGLSNSAIARALVVTEGAVEKHVSNIFSKLGLHASTDEHRRVRAVLAYLQHHDSP